jgi:2-polyprenyl-3-methyl-5-hydroxy-6-metoxy-1,4-benzoquinol methylase
MIDGSYEGFFPDYEAYVTRQVLRVKRFYKGGSVLSVGCGTGDIEVRLPFPVVCFDIHDAAKHLHPQLDFRYQWPEGQFDLVLCIGSVLPYVPTEQQPEFIERLLNSTTENGMVLMSGLSNKGEEQDIVVEHIYPVIYPSHPKIKVI